MNATRAIFLVLGIAFILAGAYMLFFQANLDRWISVGILTAGILIFVGVVVLGFAGSAPSDHHDREVVHERTDAPVVVNERRRSY